MMASQAKGCCVSQPSPVKGAGRRLDAPLASAYVWLAIWALAWIWRRWASVPAAADAWHLMGGVLGFGFAGNLVFGIGPGLITKLTGKSAPRKSVFLLGSLGLSVLAAAALGQTLVESTPSWVARVEAASLLVSAACLAGGMALQLGGTKALPDCPGARVHRSGDRWAAILATAVPGYALLAAAEAAYNQALDPSSLHLWNLGVIAMAIYAVMHQFLPRFTSAAIPQWLHGLQAGSALVTPALVSWSIAEPNGVVFGLAGLTSILAIGGCIAMAILAALHRRSASPVVWGLVASCAALLAGTLLGIHFLHGDRQAIAVHAGLNLIGFAGLAALSMGSVFLGLGIRAREQGALTPLRVVLGLTTFALINWAIIEFAFGGHLLADATLAAVVFTHAFLGIRASLPGGFSLLKNRSGIHEPN